MPLNGYLRVLSFPLPRITIWQIPIQHGCVGEDESQLGTCTVRVLPKSRALSVLLHTPLSLLHTLVTVFIHCLHSSHFTEHLTICHFPLPYIFHISHLTWSYFVSSSVYCLFHPFSSCRFLGCWWILQHLFSEETRIQCEKTGPFCSLWSLTANTAVLSA